MVGAPDSIVVRGARRSAEEHSLPHEILTAPEIHRRFPSQNVPDDFLAVLEPRAGILFPEECVTAHLEAASAGGAALHFDQPVSRWESTSSCVRLHTSAGILEAGQLVLSAGNWLGMLTPDLELPLTVERQVLHWFDSTRAAADFDPGRCPVYLWEPSPHRYFYGFPDLGDGVKVAGHHGGPAVHPDSVDRTVQPSEVEQMRELLRRYLPGANGRHRESVVCCYTNTPDEHFLIDRHPREPSVWIASPCSGHGFKFSSAVGEILADLVTQAKSRFDLSLFRHRFRLP
jgi:sarcosine oxidase